MPFPYPNATNFSLPALRLCELIAASAQFRTVVGAATPTLAMAKIFYPYADDSETDEVQYQSGALLPRALIQTNRYRSSKQGTDYAGRSGLLLFSFEFFPKIVADDIVDDIMERAAYFEEQIGTILDQMEDKAGKDRTADEKVIVDNNTTHLNLSSVELLDGPAEMFTEEQHGKLFMYAAFAAEWVG